MDPRIYVPVYNISGHSCVCSPRACSSSASPTDASPSRSDWLVRRWMAEYAHTNLRRSELDRETQRIMTSANCNRTATETRRSRWIFSRSARHWPPKPAGRNAERRHKKRYNEWNCALESPTTKTRHIRNATHKEERFQTPQSASQTD